MQLLSKCWSYKHWAWEPLTMLPLKHCTMLATACFSGLREFYSHFLSGTTQNWTGKSLHSWRRIESSEHLQKASTALLLRASSPSHLSQLRTSFNRSSKCLRAAVITIRLIWNAIDFFSNLPSLPGASWFFKYNLALKYVISYDNLSNDCLPSGLQRLFIFLLIRSWWRQKYLLITSVPQLLWLQPSPYFSGELLFNSAAVGQVLGKINCFSWDIKLQMAQTGVLLFLIHFIERASFNLEF
jgi:hypothetical protein